MDFHEMDVRSHSESGIVLGCDTCGRTVSVGVRPSSFEVITRGDRSVRHIGGTYGVVMAANLA